MTARIGDWLQVWTGGRYWPLDPRHEEVFIEDIAHALSMLCRYGGHTEQFYSVAEHSWHVSYLVPPKFALCGLLHDATEAYLVDVPRPIKPHLMNYKVLEDLNWIAIAKRFGLPWTLPPEVHAADAAMLGPERVMLMKPLPAVGAAEWSMGDVQAPAGVSIQCWPPALANWRFLKRYEELTAT